MTSAFEEAERGEGGCLGRAARKNTSSNIPRVQVFIHEKHRFILSPVQNTTLEFAFIEVG
jgi:hypothetical protein